LVFVADIVWQSASAVRGYPFSDVVAFRVTRSLLWTYTVSHSLMKQRKADEVDEEKFETKVKKLQLFVEISSGELTASAVHGQANLEDLPSGL